MKNISTSFFAMLLTILFISGCKKENTSIPVFDSATTRIKTASNSLTGITETYTYDADGRVVQIQLSDGRKTTYTYMGDTIIETHFNMAGTIETSEQMLLDSFGLVTNSVTFDSTQSIVAFHQYTFDSEGQKTQQTNYNASYVQNGQINFHWNGGNMYQTEIFDSTGTNRLYDTYIWYYDPAGTSIGNINKGQKFWGADSKYLKRKIIQYSYLYGNSLYTYEYTLDNLQRISTIKTFDYQGQLKNTETYTYY